MVAPNSEADIPLVAAELAAELTATMAGGGEGVQVGRVPRQTDPLQLQALDNGVHRWDIVDSVGPDALGGGALELDDKQGLVGYHARRDVEGGFGCLLVAPMSGGVVGVREIRRRTLGRQLAGGGIFDKDRGEWRIQD